MNSVVLLAQGVAHDLNNLLSPVLAYAELAADSLEEEDPLRQDMLEIAAATVEAVALLDKLSVSAAGVGDTRYDLDVDSTIVAMTEGMRKLLGADIELTVELGAPSARVDMEQVVFERSLLVLVENARDAMPEGGVLTIRTSTRGESGLLLDVIDTGRGMTDGVLQRLFEPFFTTRPRREVGRGLGLFSVHSAVESAGGRIVARSVSGQGASFRLTVPSSM